MSGQLVLVEKKAKVYNPLDLRWLLAAITGLLFVTMVMYKYAGLGYILLTVSVIVTAFFYRKSAGIAVSKKFVVISVYGLLLSISLMVTTVASIRKISILILVVLSLTLLFCDSEFRWVEWFVKYFLYLAQGITRMNQFFRVKLDQNKAVSEKAKHRNRFMLQVLLGVVIAVPILAVAILILSFADEIFRDMAGDVLDGIDKAFSWELDFNLGRWLVRSIGFIIISSFVYGLGDYLFKRNEREISGQEVEASKSKLHFIAPAISATILVLLNMVYCLFAYIQIRFLFFADIDSSVYDYAEYARKGFFQLILLCILNVIGILVIHNFTKSHRFNQISLTLTVVCTSIMIASSAYKMYLYEQAYGYTQLRLYVYMILLFLTVFIVFITIGIWQPTYRTIEWSIVFALGYFLIISFVNVDQIIVEKNIERYETMQVLDVAYLLELSEDAMPQVISFIEANKDILDESLYTDNRYDERIREIVKVHDSRDIFEYNMRHEAAYKAAIQSDTYVEYFTE